MNLRDIYLLSPELSVAILAAVVITVDLMVRNKRVLPIITFVGLLVPLYFSIQLWGVGREQAFSGTFHLVNCPFLAVIVAKVTPN